MNSQLTGTAMSLDTTDLVAFQMTFMRFQLTMVGVMVVDA